MASPSDLSRSKTLTIQRSKLLSLVLRHQPETIGITLDGQGWVEVAALLKALEASGNKMSLSDLQYVVHTNDKNRFAFSEDGQKIRASQGHSVEVELGYSAEEPPEILYHGTPIACLGAIRAEGLKKMARHHVHLSVDAETAAKVGGRRGKCVLLNVLAHQMHSEGFVFFRSGNGVWLTDHVPPRFLRE